MRFFEKAHRSFEWLEHGKTVVEILFALGSGRVLDAALATWTHVPQVWRAPIWLSFAAGVLALLVKFLPRKSALVIQSEDQSAESKGLLIPQNSPIAAVDKFYNRFDPTFSAEVEQALRQTAATVPAHERERYLYRGLTVAYVYSQFERLWYLIYGSQIKLLQQLNHADLKRQDAFFFYTDAAVAYPNEYVAYSFDQWIGFLRANNVIREDGDLVRITVRGRDFLKYMIDEAMPIHLKRF